jgi:hypothetical protein
MRRVALATASFLAGLALLTAGVPAAHAAGGTITGSEPLAGTGVSSTAFKLGQGGPKCDGAFLSSPLNGIDARVVFVGDMANTFRTLNWRSAAATGSVTVEFLGSDCADRHDPANGLRTVSAQNTNVVFKVPAGTTFLIVHGFMTANASFSFG